MYLWKCWRDTRIKFFIFLGLFLCLELAFLFSPKQYSGSASVKELQNGFLIVLTVIGTILLFVGWILGDDNAGADIGRGSGDFLLTRPASRGSLVWTGWAVSMLETIVLWIVFFGIIVADIFSQSRQLGISTSEIASAFAAFCGHDLPLSFLIFLINLGLIFGVTYCIGVILRSGSRALIGSAMLIFGYRIVRAILAFRFQISLPDILLAYPNPHHNWSVPAAHEFLIRGLVALAFPLLAHLMLERMEI
jgi:hypothetical protein